MFSPLPRPLVLVLFPVIVALACVFTGCGQSGSLSGSPSSSQSAMASGSPSPLIGIQPVAPDNVRTLLPQSETQPVLLAFKTQYCHDCQAMTPTLEQLKAHNPAVSVLMIDVQKDKATFGPIIDAFSPSTVPMLIPITQGGTILATFPGKLEPPKMLEIMRSIHPEATL